VVLLLFAFVPWLSKRGAGVSVVGFVVVIASVAFVGSLSYLAWKRDAGDAKYQTARRKAQVRASVATELARDGVPPDGPLAMLARDPELRGEALFTKNCATCHVLGELGDARDPKKLKAPTLDGWGGEPWNLAMLHAPDAPERFGNTPYESEMPSADVPPQEDAESFKALTKDEMDAVAAFLASQADEPGEVIDPKAVRNVKSDVGEKIVVERCTTCHLYDGKGDDGGKGLAPELHGYGSFAWTRAQIANPATPTTYREGALDPLRKGHMPAFADELPAADIDLLARWTRAHARGRSLR
jgi:ubiquinol-cytochrome c reductase cytochrome b subunit